MLLLNRRYNACQSCCQPVLRYVTIVPLFANAALLSHCHATLPVAYRFITIMPLAMVMLLRQKGCLLISRYFATHCHTARHCLGTWPLTVQAMFIYFVTSSGQIQNLFKFLLIQGHTSLFKFIQVYTCYFDSVMLLGWCHTAWPLAW